MAPTYADELVAQLRLKDLTFVRQIAELKSLSGAASQQGLTQPAASRWLRSLEELFRGHLFARDRRVGMTPTPLGHLVVERARAVVADVASLATEIDAHRSGRGGNIHLGVIPYVSSRLLGELLSTLLSEFQMTVTVVESATEPLLEALRMERLDAVIGRCSQQRLDSGLNQQVLFTQRACVLVNKASDLGSSEVDFAAMSDLRWVLPPANSPTRAAIAQACAKARVAPLTAVVETASTKVVHELVQSHQKFAAVLPFDIGSDLEKLGGVRVVPFPGNFKIPPVGLIAHTRHWEYSTIRILRNVLRNQVGKRQRLDQ
jgi:DNA-binding transcriptional LysR family regulator